jgi:hypothetical protein
MRKLILVMTALLLVGCVEFQLPPPESSAGVTATPSAAKPIVTKGAGITFSVGPDQALTYPSDLTTLPDEHTTFIPPAAGSESYLVFAATFPGTGSPVVLETKDLRSFVLASGYPTPVMSPPLRFSTCKSSYDPEFDLNYAAPGSVLQDPTRPAGNLIMIYEAENHCPGGVWQFDFYVTVGFARSADNGKSWPSPVDNELGGPDRYAIVKSAMPEPTTAEQPPVSLGDALPSAFVDGKSLYILYTLSTPGGDGLIRVAKATLGGGGTLSFLKWNNGTFSGRGIGGLDSGVLPARGCRSYQTEGSISYSDALRVYLLTFVCISGEKNASGAFQPEQGAWYFSTATRLDLQNWTVPQMIENSQFPVTTGCGAGASGNSFDGYYPSFMSPGASSGHISANGSVFFLNGCAIGKRTFMSRTFSIQGAP